MQAQNAWKVNGNNLSSGDYIGSSNARPLIFKTNNIERARFNTDGGLNISGSLKADSTTINNF
ncbi:MAG: hypothetical protein JSU07_05035, partial [Bacteroidetes bacterium]|nr:hypothetical protein [Bacteroidota bacterium]